jgi:hypothetical protein
VVLQSKPKRHESATQTLGSFVFYTHTQQSLGVVVAEADHLGGFSLFVRDGKLKHTYSFVGVFEYKQESDTLLPTGSVSVRMEFAADEPKPATGGQVTLYVNDKLAGHAITA